MIILSLDFSFAKTGWAITKIENNKLELIDCGLLISNKDEIFINRIENHIYDIEKIAYDYIPNIIIKEAAIMGRSSTGLPVIKAHGILEYVMNENHSRIEEIHNQTIKAWARKQLETKSTLTKEEIKNFDKKEMVALAITLYLGYCPDGVYTPRGRLIDDVSDAIAIGIIEGEKLLG